jgi:predicted DNA-binding transcriptional regulator YafY
MAAVEGALAKTERVMPEKLFHQARGLQEAIAFNVSPLPILAQNDFLTNLSSAVQQRRQVFLRYRSWNGEDTAREFNPYGIVFNEGYWYTSGFCHLRQDLRTFRLDRIIALEPLEQHFERPHDFDTLGHVLNSIALMPGTEQIEVLMKTSMERAQQVISPIMGSLEPSENGVIFRRSATQLEWFAYMLLQLNFPIQVIKPVELRDAIRQLAKKASQIVEDEP